MDSGFITQQRRVFSEKKKHMVNRTVHKSELQDALIRLTAIRSGHYGNQTYEVA